ncbi:leucyl/phenylalanyl-tRNA--protein transferase [Capnocytophaga cynodegmi]|uniref:Leucyl/phenylalanyl-tRNA--protein transferase n=2 Tax=Capnocytophaga cynodegmi TaxID=28189 RepID=A0A250E7L7_9FLAO|nr:leucyl/phenylalanyl-tRNA--protein transferase [Capnocytophaga cynodegmi]ATA67738.1 leucyl/phenylalanyl-tRNA--protein transferase [Capnocytophaga cynodegmi]
MIFLEENMPFPSPEIASEEGIVAYGYDLTPERLLEAYQNGIFPWYNEEEPVLWWSPNPRFVLFPEKLHISKNIKKLLRKNIYQVTYNQSFEEVIRNCASIPRKDQDGTWIHPEMIVTYTQLHQLGYAHSVEVWCENQLVGGLYGIKMGNIFCGESMFSRKSNASQVGFITFLQQHPEIKLVDCQVYSEYLEKLGAEEIPRTQFLEIIRKNKVSL